MILCTFYHGHCKFVFNNNYLKEKIRKICGVLCLTNPSICVTSTREKFEKSIPTFDFLLK